MVRRKKWQYFRHSAVKKQARFKSLTHGCFCRGWVTRVAKLQRGKYVLLMISAAIALCLVLPKKEKWENLSCRGFWLRF